jgi:hypothetical protein
MSISKLNTSKASKHQEPTQPIKQNNRTRLTQGQVPNLKTYIAHASNQNKLETSDKRKQNKQHQRPETNPKTFQKTNAKQQARA